VLLVMLWVRTRYAIDSFGCPLSKSATLGAMSRHGGIGLIFHLGNSEWSYHKYPADKFAPGEIETAFDLKTALGFVQYAKSSRAFRIRFPYWSLVLTSAVLIGLPWLRWHFSLRTLLIATTLVAVVLKLIFYAAR
jgi:hypothetical protein